VKLVNRIIASVALLLFAAAANAQPYGLAAPFQQIYFSTSGTSPGPGLPLSGGFVYTCVASSACPGTPQASYADGGGLTVNANPVLLGANGTPVNGSSPVGIFLNCALNYMIVLEDMNSVVVQKTNNVSCSSSGGGGGGGTNYWTLSGSAISNNNGAGAGAVNVGGNLNVGTNLSVVGTISMADTEATAKYAIIRAPNTMTATTTWFWPAADAAGCLNSDGMGNLSFQPCGGGGGGSPGGTNGNVQFNNSLAFGGSANFNWQNSAQLLTVTAASSTVQGIINLVGFIQSESGFLAENVAAPTTALPYNTIQAPYGGMYAKSFTALNYTNLGNYDDGTRIGTPPLTTGDSSNAGQFYWDCGGVACSMGTGSGKIYNGAAFVTLATGGATSPGGSNTQVQFNSSGSFGGSANMTFGAQKLTVTASSATVPGMQVVTGYMQADAGFLASTGTCTLWNCIQSQGGGIYGKSIRAINYTGTGFSNGVPTATNGDTGFPAKGDMYCNTATTPCVEQYYNGSAWISIGSGGGGSPGGPNTSIQYNAAGVFGGSANFELANPAGPSTDLLIVGTAATQSFYASGGYAQADGGFLATSGTCVTYNCFQAPTGGVYAKSLRAVNYAGIGFSNGVPGATSGDTSYPVKGDMYCDTSIGGGLCAQKFYNGSAWTVLATGGIPTLNGLSGALTITGTTNEIIVTPSGSTINLATPQAIATSSSPTFVNGTFTGSVSASVNMNSSAYAASSSASNAISATNGGISSALGFATTNTALNSIQTAGSFNACNTGSCAGSVAYQVNGSTVITEAGGFVGAGVLTTGLIAGAQVNASTYFSVGLAPGVTKTCTVLPTVVGGIITSC
jgi:hypothetical protein